MPSPIELALAQLLPTVSYLPPDLVSLANSLLSQSRAKAASLKPEEEIGRTFACAHIACERLKNRLELDVDKPKPPCKPRVYAKLYQYLESVLGRGDVRTPTSTRKKDALGGTPGTGRKIADVTPSKKPEVKTPRTGEKRAREGNEKKEKDDDVPEYVMPMIRAVCKATDTLKAAPHVLVGARAAMQEIKSRTATQNAEPPSKRRRKTPQSAKSNGGQTETSAVTAGVPAAKWPALIVALHALTVARMKGLEADDEVTEAIKSKAVRGLKSYTASDASTLPEEIASSLRTIGKDIDFYLLEAEDSGWLDMQWYQNVPDNIASWDVDEEHYNAEDNDDAEQSAGEGPVTPRKRPGKTPLRRKEKHGGKAALASGLFNDEPGAAGLLQGLGTMFQPAVDWLSDERRAEYALWKKGILKEISRVEQEAA